jgi:hypothetical protein
MNKWNPEPSPTPDWDAEEVGAALGAQSLPAGSDRSSQEGGPTSQRRRCLSIRLFNRTEATRIRVLGLFRPLVA